MEMWIKVPLIGGAYTLQPMDFDEFVALAESFPHAVLDYPFGEDVRVYKVGGKMFCLLSEGAPHTVAVKADPEMILEQRAAFPEAVGRAPYMHDRHWNRVHIANVPDFELEDWVEDSYALVLAGLTKKVRDTLGS